MKTVVVDHGFHVHTGSSHFLTDVLEGDVTTLWDESWQGGPAIRASQINALDPDAVVFFQCRPTRAILARLRCRNLTWIPMRDDVRMSVRWWRRISGLGLKVACFSRSVQEFAQPLGFQTLGIRYFPPPPDGTHQATTLPRVYWWYRTRDIDAGLVLQLLPHHTALELVVKNTPDPGQPPVQAPARWPAAWTVEVHDQWQPHAQHRQLLESCSHYVAPRMLEGIGMGVLEAMGLGQCVIAPDRPTMNEYIVHRHNGLLYDPDHPSTVSLDEASAIGSQAREDAVAGHRQWQDVHAPALAAFVARQAGHGRNWWRVAAGRLRSE